MTPTVTVEIALVGPEPSGLAQMLARLLRSNLDRHPERSALLRPATIELIALDAEVRATVRLRPGRIEIGTGAPGRPADVRIRGASGDLLAMSAAPLRLGLPDPLDRDGRAVLARMALGRVRISGMLRNPGIVSRFARLLSVA